MSSKNRKNKVYLYWHIITREKLFTYLDAKRYLALVAARSDNDYDIRKNDYTRNYQKYLEKKLYRMFDDEYLRSQIGAFFDKTFGGWG